MAGIPAQPMRVRFDGRFAYRGYFDCPSHCHVRIYVGRGSLPVVVASEVADNPGTSITHAAAFWPAPCGKRSWAHLSSLMVLYGASIILACAYRPGAQLLPCHQSTRILPS
jgi:hypothetical protein